MLERCLIPRSGCGSLVSSKRDDVIVGCGLGEALALPCPRSLMAVRTHLALESADGKLWVVGEVHRS
jgi:hypothetical protein